MGIVVGVLVGGRVTLRKLAAGCTCDSNTATSGGFELPSAVVVARYR